MHLVFALLATASAFTRLKGLSTTSCPSPLEFDQEKLNQTDCFLQRRTTGFPETRFRASTEKYFTHVECRVAGLQPEHAYTVWNIFQDADFQKIGYPQNAAYGYSDAAGNAKFATEGWNGKVYNMDDEDAVITEEQWDAFRTYLVLMDHGPKDEDVDQFSSMTAGCVPLEEGEECPVSGGTDGETAQEEHCIKTLSGSFYQETCQNRCGFIGSDRGGRRDTGEEDEQDEEADVKQFGRFGGFRRGIRLPQRGRRDDVPSCGCDRNCERQNNCCVDVAEECPNIRILPKRARASLFANRCPGSVFRQGPSAICPDIPPRSPGFYKDCVLCPSDDEE
jgi:hypothetical protein